MTHTGGFLVLGHNNVTNAAEEKRRRPHVQDLFVERMSPLQFWLLLVIILFTSAASAAENDGVGMVTSFMTQLAALLERNDLRLLLEVENQPTNHKKPEDVIWKNIDGDEGVLLRTLTAHIPCR